MPASTGTGQPPRTSANRSSTSRSNTIWVIANRAPAATFARNRSASSSRSSAVGFTATPGKNAGRRVDRPAVEVLAAIEPRDQAGQPDRVDLVDALRAGVVADLGRVAGDREHVPDTLPNARRGAATRARAPSSRASSGAGSSRGRSSRSIAHATISALIPARAVALSFTSTNRTTPDASSARRDLEQAPARAAEGRVELDRDDELARPERRCECGLALLARRARRRPRARSHASRTRAGRLGVDGGADRRDLGRASSRSSRRSRARRARAPPRRTPRSTRASRAGRSPCRRARLARPMFGSAASGTPAAVHLLERGQGRQQARAVVRADRGDAEVRRAARPPARARTPGERLGVARRRSGAQRPAAPRRCRTAAIATTSSSRSKNVSSMKRSAPRSSSTAACSAKSSRRRSSLERLAERPDRAADEHVAARQLARLAGELHPGRR